MFVNRTHGVVATTLGVLALGACASPEQNTDLRPEGPPDVLAVLVMTDASSQLSEHATFCRPNDAKRPSLVTLPDATTSQICPEDGSAVTDGVADAYPDGWYVRIMFDELLDPAVEELVDIDEETQSGTIANTHPVELRCKSMVGGALVDVPYDGYYSPAGNSVTWPLGPSLVIKPNDPKIVATDTECQVTITDVVTDKDGNVVPMDQRGPFKFKIAPIQAIAIDPADDPDGESPVDANTLWYENASVQFNTLVDPASLCTDADDDGNCDGDPIFEFKDVAHPSEGPGKCSDNTTTCGTKTDCPTGMQTICGKGLCSDSTTVCNADADCATGDSCNTTYAYALDSTDTQFGFGPKWPLQVERSYTFGFVAGAKLADRCGKETTLTSAVADNTLSHFKTNPFKFNKTNIATGETSAPTKKPLFSFSNVLRGGDKAGANLVTGGAIAATDYTLEPPPVDAAGVPLANAAIVISDPGLSGQMFFRGHYKLDTEYTLTIKAGTKVKDWYGVEYTFTDAKVIKWKTSPTITATFSPADGTVLTAADPMAIVTIKFNQSINTTTFTAADYSLTTDAGAAVTGIVVAPGALDGVSTCGTTGTGCALTLVGTLAPGKYKFTMKMGAEVTDFYGAKYTQAADKVINFEVKAAPSTTTTCL